MKYGRRDPEPFDRAQHRYRRGQHGVPVEERRPENAETEHEPAVFFNHPVPGNKERQEGEDAPLPVVVRAHNIGRIFQRDNNYQGPENQGENPEYILVYDFEAVLVRKTFAEGVERARPYVTENDTESD